MASLGMGTERFSLDVATIDKVVTTEGPGNFALGFDNPNGGKFIVKFVGRDDADLGNRLKWFIEHKPKSWNKFKFSHASNAERAYLKECQNYHDFPNKRNKTHPAYPTDHIMSCPVCGSPTNNKPAKVGE